VRQAEQHPALVHGAVRGCVAQRLLDGLAEHDDDIGPEAWISGMNTPSTCWRSTGVASVLGVPPYRWASRKTG
jgi:hypothetical protein